MPEALVDLLGVAGMERARQRADWFVQQQRQQGIEHHLWLEAAKARDAEQTVARVKPDFLIVSNGVPSANFFVKRTAIQLGIPFIIVEHLVHPIRPKEVPQAYAELAQQYEAAKAVIAVSQDSLRLLRKLFGLAEDKGQVIYCGRPPSYSDFQMNKPQ